MASDWPPSTTPSSALHQEHMAAKPFEADQMDIAPALSQSLNPAKGFDEAKAGHGFTPYWGTHNHDGLGNILAESINFIDDKITDEFASSSWQGPSQHRGIVPPGYTALSGLFSASLTQDNAYPVFDPAIFDQPFNGRYLCNVPGCSSTFTRKADRDRHIQSWHNYATLHLCPVPGCKKSLGKPYSRKDKLQEHMRKKHAGLA